MNDDDTNEDDVPDAPVTRSRRRVSVVWFIPVVALLLGGWLVWQHFAEQGVLVTVEFQTAEGVVAGKTTLQCRSVIVGLVESVRLSEDLSKVLMGIRVTRGTGDLLQEDSRFWIVRPRVGGGGVSGLGTIVSGSYLEVEPGLSEERAQYFEGLEEPPTTPQDVPGLRLKLIADEGGSLSRGASVTYKGINVGRIESRTFEAENDRVIFDIFIEERFQSLVSNHTRFWNTSGVDLELDSEGLRLRTGSLESMVSGGVAFETADTVVAGEPIENGRMFRLFESRRGVEDSMILLKPKLTYLLMFEDSVRGLSVGAPVEFRGIRVGTVRGISFDYAPNDPAKRIPVLIELDPGSLSDGPVTSNEEGLAQMEARVKEGLRASLKTGSILTGQLFVNLTLDAGAPPAEVASIGKFTTLPTVSAGLAKLEDKVVQFLDKIQALPIEDTLTGANEALAEIEAAAATLKDAAGEIETLVASDEIRALPAKIDEVLEEFRLVMEGLEPDSQIYTDITAATEELRETLRSVKTLADSVDRKPNSLIFGRGSGKVEPPKAKR